MFSFFCAQDWTRTSTSLRTLRPEHSVSTNFTTWAVNFPDANIRQKKWNENKKSLNVYSGF